MCGCEADAMMRRLDRWPTSVASESVGVAFADGRRTVEWAAESPSNRAFCSRTSVLGSRTRVFGSMCQAGLGGALTAGLEYDGPLVRMGERGALLDDLRRRRSETGADWGFDWETRDNSESKSDKMSR
jgi:hypothetical protein